MVPYRLKRSEGSFRPYYWSAMEASRTSTLVVSVLLTLSREFVIFRSKPFLRIVIYSHWSERDVCAMKCIGKHVMDVCLKLSTALSSTIQSLYKSVKNYFLRLTELLSVRLQNFAYIIHPSSYCSLYWTDVKIRISYYCYCMLMHIISWCHSWGKKKIHHTCT